MGNSSSLGRSASNPDRHLVRRRESIKAVAVEIERGQRPAGSQSTVWQRSLRSQLDSQPQRSQSAPPENESRFAHGGASGARVETSAASVLGQLSPLDDELLRCVIAGRFRL